MVTTGATKSYLLKNCRWQINMKNNAIILGADYAEQRGFNKLNP